MNLRLHVAEIVTSMMRMNPFERINGWNQFPTAFRQCLVLGTLMLLFLIYDQQAAWRAREDYYFGFLVPVFVYLVLEERWGGIRALFRKREEGAPLSGKTLLDSPIMVAGVVLALVGGIASLLLGGFIRAVEGSSSPASLAINVGFIVSFFSLVLLAVRARQLEQDGYVALTDPEKWKLVGYFCFPVLIWLLSAPMVAALESRISIFLLNQVTVVVYHTFNFLGFAIEQQGNTLNLPRGSVGVAEACSGIRSLMACLFAGSVMSALYLNKIWKKVLLVAMAMLLAFVMNLFRSLFLTAWAYAYGSEAIEGTVHDVTGYAVLGLTCVGLFLLLPLFNFKLPQELPNESNAAAS